MEDEQEKGFVIKDRRIFSETGEPKPGDAQVDKIPVDDAPGQNRPSEPESLEHNEAQLPEVTFSTFVVSLSSSALLHLGVIPDPTTGKHETNFAVAKQTIDLLAMLQDKTKGNLSLDEQGLLKNILYELRMRFVSKTA